MLPGVDGSTRRPGSLDRGRCGRPVPHPPPPRPGRRHSWRECRPMARLLIRLALVLALVAAAGGGYWWWHHQSDDGVHLANGRLEATEVLLASRLAGTLRQLPVQERSEERRVGKECRERWLPCE